MYIGNKNNGMKSRKIAASQINERKRVKLNVNISEH